MAVVQLFDVVTIKKFTEDDVDKSGQFERISADRSELVDAQPEWMKRGLQETASGYGRRLNSGYKIYFNGRLYRLYVTIFSNAGTMWFKTKGRTIIVS